MRYKVGMYGGCFDPLHIGHINNILASASMCEILHLVLFYNPVRDRINYRLRYRWLLDTTKHLPNVNIIVLQDNDETKEQCDWETGANNIKSAIGTEIDIVFCGDDYRNTGVFEKLYPHSKIWYFSRAIVPISSTEIYNNPMKYWDYIPKVAQPYFCKKVLLIGGESTGKSTLVRSLALAYNTNCVEEYGRFTCERAGGEDFMTPQDLQENIIMQRANIYKAQETANKLLFVDTDSLTTTFYGDILATPEHIMQWWSCEDLGQWVNSTIQWDLVIFLEPTVPFVQDGTRSDRIGAERQEFSDKLKKYYDENDVRYITLSGDYYARFSQAKMLINYHCGM